MLKNYTSLGLMSGTSGDGVDASLITSNGVDKFQVIKDGIFDMILQFMRTYIV